MIREVSKMSQEQLSKMSQEQVSKMSQEQAAACSSTNALASLTLLHLLPPDCFTHALLMLQLCFVYALLLVLQ